jgi:hypothetical protein
LNFTKTLQPAYERGPHPACFHIVGQYQTLLFQLHTQNHRLQQELERERITSETYKQDFYEAKAELQDYESQPGPEEIHDAEESQKATERALEQAESVINGLRAQLAKERGAPDSSLAPGKSIGQVLLESAKNEALVRYMGEMLEGSEEGIVSTLADIANTNVQFQVRNRELTAEVESGKNEIASLRKALEITAGPTEGPSNRRKRARKNTEKMTIKTT